jgi:predicted unusual protein kinase regulating ubiquinone biosynthesis (AarF/ABC1/UbiB family)
VFFDLSSDAVLVQEFVTGMWLWEIIGALEQNDPQGLEMMRQLEIDPPTVARRILWAEFWSTDEQLFFHADPHPANIVVGPGGLVTFIDFGSCGTFNNEQRRAFEQIAASMRKGDAAGMARATLKLLEPLPPIDVPSLMKFIEAEYIRLVCTFRTKAEYTEWWERTSIKLWLAMVNAAQHYGLSMNLDTLKMLRGSLLYDTITLRLDRRISRHDEYERFRTKDRERWAEQRWRKRARNMRRDRFLHLEALAEAGDDLITRAQQTIASPILSFGSVIEKWVFTFSVLSRTAGRLLEITGAAVAALAAVRYFRSETPQLLGSLLTVLRYRPFQLVVLAVIALSTRDIVFRLTERDVKSRDAGR